MKRYLDWFVALPLPFAMVVSALCGFGVGAIAITLANVARILFMIVGWQR